MICLLRLTLRLYRILEIMRLSKFLSGLSDKWLIKYVYLFFYVDLRDKNSEAVDRSVDAILVSA